MAARRAREGIATAAAAGAGLGFEETAERTRAAWRVREGVTGEDRRCLFSLATDLSLAAALRGLSGTAGAVVHRISVEVRTVATRIADELAEPGSQLHRLI